MFFLNTSSDVNRDGGKALTIYFTFLWRANKGKNRFLRQTKTEISRSRLSRSSE
jgi:hypothetical protein